VVDASTSPVSAAIIDHTDSTWIDLYAERKAVVKDMDADVKDLIEGGAGRVRLKGGAFQFAPLKSWMGNPVIDKVENYRAEVYECSGRLVAVVLKKAAIQLPPGCTFSRYLEMDMPQDESEEVPWDPLKTPPPSVRETFAASLSADEAALAELQFMNGAGPVSSRDPALGINREEQQQQQQQQQQQLLRREKERGRQVSGRCWMAHGYPISLHHLLPLLEAIGPANKHIQATVGFLNQYKGESLFPVKIKIPLMWTVYISLKFRNFKRLGLEGRAGLQLQLQPEFFQVPSSYTKTTLVPLHPNEPVEDTFYDASEV